MIKTNWFGRGLRLQIAIVIACQMAFILFGYDQGVFSGIVTNSDWLDTFGHPSSGLEGIIVSIYNLGAFSGCILTFFFGEKLGRRLCMWVAMGWIIVGAVLQCTSYSVPQIMIARYITGIGTGIETSTVPMYQSELCDAERRGRLVSSEPLFVGIGIVISYFFDYGMRYVGGPVAWRVPVACQVVFAFVVIFLVFGLPESPRWLYYHGKNEEALQVLCDVWDSPPDGEKVVNMQTEILDAMQLEKKTGECMYTPLQLFAKTLDGTPRYLVSPSPALSLLESTYDFDHDRRNRLLHLIVLHLIAFVHANPILLDKWSQLFKRDEVQTGRRVLLAYGMQFMNQMGGINLVVYYVPSALENNVGLSSNLSLVIGGCVQTMFFFGSLIPTFFLDRMGRRRPMMWGSLGCGMSMMLISVLLSFNKYRGYSESAQTATASASVTFFFTYMLFFGATANCIPWVYVPEILPLHARAKGTAIGISSNWLWNFVVVMITPTLLGHLNWRGYLIFMCTNFAFIPLVYFFYPETSNLSLESVDHLFTKEGRHGLEAVTAPTQPVQESFKMHQDDEEKAMGGQSTEHVEAPEEIKDDKSG